MKNYTVLPKKDFNEFIRRLAKIQKVTAPVARGVKNFAFGEVACGDEISLKYIPTILPPKKYFMPPREKLIEYNKSEDGWQAVLEYEKMVIFGVHTCDLAAIECLDMVLCDEPKDINYIVRKKKITIIGLECNDYCDEYASCALVDNYIPSGGYDLFFTEIKDSFIVDVNTQAGEDIVKKTKVFKKSSYEQIDELDEIRNKKREIFKSEVNVAYKGVKPLFDKSFSAKAWQDIGKRCVACGNCTNVCPTCYCFDVVDEPNLDLNTGIRYRQWDSCQNEEFAKIAGGENFRKLRGNRQRHRYMRKFNYPFDKYNRYFCTGCGRCTRACMANISLKETINSLVEEAK